MQISIGDGDGLVGTGPDDVADALNITVIALLCLGGVMLICCVVCACCKTNPQKSGFQRQMDDVSALSVSQPNVTQMLGDASDRRGLKGGRGRKELTEISVVGRPGGVIEGEDTQICMDDYPQDQGRRLSSNRPVDLNASASGRIGMLCFPPSLAHSFPPSLLSDKVITKHTIDSETGAALEDDMLFCPYLCHATRANKTCMTCMLRQCCS